MRRNRLASVPALFLLAALLSLRAPSGASDAPVSQVPASEAPAKSCVFCQIAAGTAPAKKLFEDELVVAFHDRWPRAKVHVLVIPKAHVANMAEVDRLPEKTRAALLSACARVARETGIEASGFRVAVNSGTDAGQSVGHLHFHVLGGETLPMLQPREVD